MSLTHTSRNLPLWLRATATTILLPGMVVQESSALWSWAVSRVLPSYRYRPGMLKGEPVSLWVQQTIRYPAGRQSERDMLHLRRPY